MTPEEKQEIINEVIAALRESSMTITDLENVEELPSDSYIELSGGKKISASKLSKIIADSVKPETLTEDIMSHYRGRKCKVGGLIKNRVDDGYVCPAIKPTILSSMKDLGMDYIITSFKGVGNDSNRQKIVDNFITTLQNADNVGGLEVYQSCILFTNKYLDYINVDDSDYTTDYKQSLTRALTHPSFKGIWMDEPLPYSSKWKGANAAQPWVDNAPRMAHNTDGAPVYYEDVHKYFGAANREDVVLDINLLPGHAESTWNESEGGNINVYVNPSTGVSTNYANHTFCDRNIPGSDGSFIYNWRGSFEKYIRDYLVASDAIGADYYPVKYGIHYKYSGDEKPTGIVKTNGDILSDITYPAGNISNAVYRLEERKNLLGEWALGMNYLLYAYQANPDKKYGCWIETSQHDKYDDEGNFNIWGSRPILTPQSLALQCWCSLICGVSNISYFCLSDTELERSLNKPEYEKECNLYSNAPYAVNPQTLELQTGSTWNLVQTFNNGKFKKLKDYIASKYIYGIDIYAYYGKTQKGSYLASSMPNQPNLRNILSIIPDFITNFTNTSKFMVSVGYDDDAEYLFIVNLNFLNQDDPLTNYEGMEVESPLVLTPNLTYGVQQVTYNTTSQKIEEITLVNQVDITVDPCDICILRIPYGKLWKKKLHPKGSGQARGGVYTEKNAQIQLQDEVGDNVGTPIQLEYIALKGYNTGNETFDAETIHHKKTEQEWESDHYDDFTGESVEYLTYADYVYAYTYWAISYQAGNWPYRGQHGIYTVKREHRKQDGSYDNPIDAQAHGEYSVALGKGVRTYGVASHATGWGNKAKGDYSSVENADNVAIGERSHAGGAASEATGNRAFVHAILSSAAGEGSHVEGSNNIATGSYAHAENVQNKAQGTASHVGGQINVASGERSFAHGLYLKAQNQDEVTFGRLNESTTGEYEKDVTIFSIGIGQKRSSQDTGYTHENFYYRDGGKPGAYITKHEQLYTKRMNAIEIRKNGDFYLWLNGQHVKLQDFLAQITIPSGATPAYGARTESTPSEPDAPIPVPEPEPIYPDPYYYYSEVGHDDVIDDDSEEIPHEIAEPVWESAMAEPETEESYYYYSEVGGDDDNNEEEQTR